MRLAGSSLQQVSRSWMAESLLSAVAGRRAGAHDARGAARGAGSGGGVAGGLSGNASPGGPAPAAAGSPPYLSAPGGITGSSLVLTASRRSLFRPAAVRPPASPAAARASVTHGPADSQPTR